MGIIRKIALFTLFVALGGAAAALAAFPAERVYAGTYDISKGNVTIDCSLYTQKVTVIDENDNYYNSMADPNPVITGSSDSNKITINTDPSCDAWVKLSGVDIDLSNKSDAAISITGSGKAVIELEGNNNILKSGFGHAGIEKNDSDGSGTLEIRGDGSLNVTAGQEGAGIGGRSGESASNITITGETIYATGISGGAGIGGGPSGKGSSITIKGGTVHATGGTDGAGIGGGIMGEGSDIEITGGTVYAIGGDFAAGIGGGSLRSGSGITITGGTVYATGGYGGAGIGGGIKGTASDISISGSAGVMAAGGNTNPSPYSNIGAAIGTGSSTNASGTGGSPGTDVEPNTSGLYNTGFIRFYPAGTGIDAMKNGSVTPYRIITGTIPDPSQPENPSEDKITVSDNKPMAVSTETRGDFKITYAHEIPFYGKGKITPESFGGITVSQGNATYQVTKIKVNKKKHTFQITGLSGADKDTVKKIKKATKGSNGLPFKCNPYYVRDTDKVTPKFKKNGTLKSVKIFINGKDYKAKKDEYSYDSSTSMITFKGTNLNGSYTSK